MRFETKIAIVLRADVPIWQRLNMTAFLCSGIAATVEGIVGEPYQDASEQLYLPMFRQPVLVFRATADELRKAYARAHARGRPCARCARWPRARRAGRSAGGRSDICADSDRRDHRRVAQ